MNEIEGKFKVDDFSDIIGKLSGIKPVVTDEENHVIDLFGLLERGRWLFRLRRDGRYLLTIKGKDKGTAINERFEYEIEIPKVAFILLKTILPKKCTYLKRRETYRTGGCNVCLDDVSEVGKFVEIEGPGIGKILLLKEKLGIYSESIRVPYYKMLMEVRK